MLAAVLVWNGDDPLNLAAPVRVLVPGVVAAAAYLRLSHRGQLLFLGTLGIGPGGVLVPALLPGAVAELLLSLVEP
jgi:hypothetical protein